MHRRGIFAVAIALLLASACATDFDGYAFGLGAGGSLGGHGQTGGGSPGGGGPGGGGPGGAGPGGMGPGGSGGAAAGGMGQGAGVPGQLACGSSSCDLGAGEICCVPKDQQGMAFCHQAMVCPADEGEMRCDGPEDCGTGEVCCGDFSLSAGGYESVACASDCPGLLSFVLCASQADCDMGDTCQASSYLPPGVWVCF